MDTNTSTGQCQVLFAKWHQEHRQLEALTDELRRWAYEISQLGIPHFGEAANRLTQLRTRLVEHFHREDEIGERLLGEPSPTVEVQAMCRQAANDHTHLLKRLDDLISRLNQNEPPFDSWQQAIREVELFMDAVEQHEEQEHANITWLTPADEGPS